MEMSTMPHFLIMPVRANQNPASCPLRFCQGAPPATHMQQASQGFRIAAARLRQGTRQRRQQARSCRRSASSDGGSGACSPCGARGA